MRGLLATRGRSVTHKCGKTQNDFLLLEHVMSGNKHAAFTPPTLTATPVNNSSTNKTTTATSYFIHAGASSKPYQHSPSSLLQTGGLFSQ